MTSGTVAAPARLRVTRRGTAPQVVLLGFAVLGAAPWRRPAAEPDRGPEVLDAPSAARPEVPAGAGEGTH